MVFIQLAVSPVVSVWGITISLERTFRIIFQLNNLYFLPWCAPGLSHFGMRCAYGFCMYEKERGREPGGGQSVARDQSLQPNNIHNIHQICINYLRGVLSILQMCMCVWKGPACRFSLLRLSWSGVHWGGCFISFYFILMWRAGILAGSEFIKDTSKMSPITISY